MFVQNLENSNLLRVSAKMLSLECTYLTFMHLWCLIPCRANTWINFMHCGQLKVNLFTICIMASLSQKIATCASFSWACLLQTVKAIVKANSSRNSMIGLQLVMNFAGHWPTIQLSLKIAPYLRFSFKEASE